MIGLDQRGHGWSGHTNDLNYSRKSYISDIHNFIQKELSERSVVILGHSLGGANAYQFTSRYPHLVKALIVEDIGAECNDDLTFAKKFPNRTSTFKQMKQAFD